MLAVDPRSDVHGIAASSGSRLQTCESCGGPADTVFTGPVRTLSRAPLAVAVILVLAVGVAGYLTFRPPFKENGVTSTPGEMVSSGDFAFAFPPFANGSPATVTVTGLSIDHVPAGVTVTGYRLVDLGPDEHGYRTSWDAADPTFDLHRDPLFEPGARLIVPRFTTHRLFAMVEYRVNAHPSGPLSGCTVRYRSVGLDRTQHLVCTENFQPG